MPGRHLIYLAYARERGVRWSSRARQCVLDIDWAALVLLMGTVLLVALLCLGLFLVIVIFWLTRRFLRSTH